MKSLLMYISLICCLLFIKCNRLDDEIAGTYTWSYSVEMGNRWGYNYILSDQSEDQYELILKKSGKGILLKNGEKWGVIPKDSMIFTVSGDFLSTNATPFTDDYYSYRNIFYKNQLDCSASDFMIGSYTGIYKTNKYSDKGFATPDNEGYSIRDTTLLVTAEVVRRDLDNACFLELHFREHSFSLPLTLDQMQLAENFSCEPSMTINKDSLIIQRDEICVQADDTSVPIYLEFRGAKN